MPASASPSHVQSRPISNDNTHSQWLISSSAVAKVSDELSGASVCRMRLLQPNWIRSPGLPMSVSPLKSTSSCAASRCISVLCGSSLPSTTWPTTIVIGVVDLRRIGLQVERLQLVRLQTEPEEILFLVGVLADVELHRLAEPVKRAIDPVGLGESEVSGQRRFRRSRRDRA